MDSNNVQAQLIKPSEAARISGVSSRTITRMCGEGTIAAVKLRGSWRINRQEFMRKLGIEA